MDVGSLQHDMRNVYVDRLTTVQRTLVGMNSLTYGTVAGNAETKVR